MGTLDLRNFPDQNFDPRNGLAVSEEGYCISCRAIATAVRQLEEALDRLGYDPSTTLQGVGGSYAFGDPRVGLYPAALTYEQADEAQRDDARKYPSDLDVKLLLPSLSEVELEVSGVLRSIFDRTRVLISWKPGLDLRVIPTDQLWSRL